MTKPLVPQLISKSRPAIRTHARPTCFLCGGQGRPLYDGLEDRVFGAPGRWDLLQCSTQDCDLTWLAMMPLPEDLGLAYASYYTHTRQLEGDAPFAATLVVKRLLLHALYSRFLWRSGLVVEREELDNMTLRSLPPGRMLDVGCGSGTLLQRMRIAGWEVEGVDFDEKAIDRAWREYGVAVRHGDLRAACYPDGSFDAVTMNHFIEHVHDPIAVLTESRRILRPGGQLVVVTPNIAGWGHARFGRNWRGLEPPRHLHLFSPKTLAQTALRAGFARTEVRPRAPGPSAFCWPRWNWNAMAATPLGATPGRWTGFGHCGLIARSGARCGGGRILATRSCSRRVTRDSLAGARMGLALKATSLRTAFFKNAMVNVVRLAAGSVVALLLTPLLVRQLSTETYAAWVLIVQLSAYVMFLDFGIQNAVSHFVAYTEEKQDLNLRDGIVSSAVWSLAGLAAIGVLLIGGLAWQLPRLFDDLPASLQPVTRTSLLLVGISWRSASRFQHWQPSFGTAAERNARGYRDCRAGTLGGDDRRSGPGAP